MPVKTGYHGGVEAAQNTSRRGTHRTLYMCGYVLMLAGALCFPAASFAGKVAPPASPAAVSACETQVTAAKKTQDIRQRVYGTIWMGGCVVDGGTGIAHAYLEWKSESSDAHGRICTDPQITRSLWQCAWDTTLLEPGKYSVQFVAIDDAGNRGSFDRPYEIGQEAITPSNSDGSGEAQGSSTESAEDTEFEDSTDSPSGQPPPDANDAETTPEAVTPIPDSTQLIAPATDQWNAIVKLAIQRIYDCARNEVAHAPTSSPDVVTQLDQANLVAVCVDPALTVLGADAVLVDQLPVPPVVVIQMLDEASMRALAQLLPVSIAGVPVALERPCERDETDPCQPLSDLYPEDRAQDVQAGQ